MLEKSRRFPFEILRGDCLQLLKGLPAGLVNCCVTSPPYFGLRDYGAAGQIGLEESPEKYVGKLVEVFREVRRVLADDGTLWLNLGDSYSRSPAKGGSGPGGKNKDRWGYGKAQAAKFGSSDGFVRRAEPSGLRLGGLGEKQLLGIPWRVAFALQADGWLLRQDIIWSKPNPMPESVRDRCTKAHEYIFLFAKSARYFYDFRAVSEAAKEPRGSGNKKPYLVPGQRIGENANLGGSLHKIGARLVRNKRSVWTVKPKPFRGAHFATFPPDLVRPCILAGCPSGGLVLDPFCGSGTSGVVSLEQGRKFLGCELNPEYAQLSENRLLEIAKNDLFAGAF